ncbi:uncharacterized protein [Diadema antillarum]|uniref:uncharacterized protein n=1 Tax=Diadema antillarum TaxID=105358 RepID=UPI003A89CA61
MEQIIVDLSGRINLWTYLSMVSWVTMNICLTNVNKWLFMSYGFPYPLFITSLHMLCTAAFGFIVIRFTPLGAVYGEGNERLKLPPHLTPKILILSVVSTVSIACGNIALKHLYVSFVKMILAMTPLATVVISKVLLGRQFDIFTYLSMLPLCFGSFLCTVGEVNFSIFGFVAAFTATLLRAGRCVLQGVLLKEERIDSVRLLYHICIPSFLQLGVASLLFEEGALWDERLRSSAFLWGIISLSCACAVGYNILAFLVTYYTSPVTLQVLGNVSIVLTVGISLVIFQNEVSTLSIFGIGFILLGSIMYQEAGIARRFFQRFL